jgi:hypothetical protein
MRPHQCHLCDRQFIEQLDLAAHILEAHKVSEKQEPNMKDIGNK